MKVTDFKLERYFGVYEFTAPYQIANSDCDSMTVGELLSLEPGAHEGFMNQWMGYSDKKGNPELREQIAQTMYQAMTEKNILVCSGAQEAIFAFMNSVLDKGDHVIVMYPSYASTYEVANSIPGCEFSLWRLKDEADHWSCDFDELEALIQSNTKVIAVNSPNNPTGYTFTNAEMKKLAEICEKNNIILFSDEIYNKMERDGEPRIAACDIYEKAFSLGVMSKSFGLPGLRIGWLAGQDTELLYKINKFKDYTTCSNSAVSEYLAKVALRNSKAILDKSRTLVESNLKLVEEFFARHSGIFAYHKAPAGAVGYHKLLMNMTAEEFCNKAVEEKGVLLLPGYVYDMPGSYFRMGYGRRNLVQSIEKLEEFINDNNFDDYPVRTDR